MKKEAGKVQEPTARSTSGTKPSVSSGRSEESNLKSTSLRQGDDLMNVTYKPYDRFVNIAEIDTADGKKFAVSLGNMGILTQEEWLNTERDAIKIAQIAQITYRVINVIQILNEQRNKK